MARLTRLLPGLFVLLAVGCSSASAHPSEIVVDIEHSRFVPERIAVGAGTTVTFVIKNSDPIDHEFIIGDQTVQDVHENGTEAHHGKRPGEISVPALESVSTTYTFDEPGELIYGCHLPSHYDFGMKGVIRISG